MKSEALDTGTGYTRKAPTYNAGLTEVGRGKPMGELLRRYWHPIALVADAGTTPKPVRVLGEDLILFRDGAGRAGLVEARCCHRGTTLYYGRVEERGFAAAITAGCSTRKAVASNSRASRKEGSNAIACASPGIPCRNSTG